MSMDAVLWEEIGLLKKRVKALEDRSPPVAATMTVGEEPQEFTVSLDAAAAHSSSFARMIDAMARNRKRRGGNIR